MQASHETRAHAPRPSGASNNAVVVILVLTVAFGYFGCVKPMYEQMRSMRLSMTCLQNRVAKLVREADTAGEGAGLLVHLAEQRSAVADATAALDEIEALNRRLAERTRRIALLATADDLAAQTERRIVEHRELLGDAEQALRSALQVERKMVSAGQQVTAAGTAADRMRALCNQMVASRAMIEDAHTAGEDLTALQERLILASRATPAANQAIERLTKLTTRVASSGSGAEDAGQELAELESLRERLLASRDQSGQANEALEVLTDLRNDVISAENDFQNLRKVVLEVVLMQPAVNRAVAALTPIRQLATLRHLDVEQLRVAAQALSGQAEAAIVK